ncbi:leucine-rich repeat domain-containing protein [[Mycoplasma] anseris]|uniref:Leucine-rich repeat domain-containing protein n=1 Tax=[Mycoplasma] anseris TaxID=92400 RepID=A0A2Z4NCR5_9BACT|nr:leucine-rich repeat domain-containing protein [[Mycoplasma] anseris]AWX69363.1 leucine-rich repeat domain-containing protein [[Mycoplasma] anseris]
MKKSRFILFTALATISPLAIGTLSLSCSCSGEKANAFAAQYWQEGTKYYNKDTKTLDLSKENIESIPDGAFARRTLLLFKTAKDTKTLDLDKNPIDNLILPANIKSIGKGAFEYLNLKTVSIKPNHENNIEIHERAFLGNQLTTIDLPKNVSYIGDQAFADNKLTEIALPSKITKLTKGMLAGNELTNIDLTNIVVIERSALEKNNISALNLPSTLVSAAFDFVNNNPSKVSLTILNEELKKVFAKELETNPEAYNYTIA